MRTFCLYHVTVNVTQMPIILIEFQASNRRQALQQCADIQIGEFKACSTEIDSIHSLDYL